MATAQVSPMQATDKATARLRRVAAASASAFFHAHPAAAAAARAAGDDARARLFDADAGEFGPMVDELVDLIRNWTPYDDRVQFIALLNALDTKAGTLALAGRAAVKGGRVRSFPQMAPAEREALFLRWLDGPLPPLVQAVKGLKCLAFMVLFRFADPATGTNPLWPGIGYPGPPPPSERKPVVKAKQESEAVLLRGLVDLVAAAPATAAAAKAVLAAAGLAPADGAKPGDVVLNADAVVVGSGAGGGTAAAVLARAGLKVVVLEKGRYTPAADLPLTEAHGFTNMYERGTLFSTKDLSVNVLAGATVGGGTRINWCASFPTPAHVRDEWVTKHGLTDFAGPRYERALAAVCGRGGVATGVSPHSNHNACLGAGLDALGEHRGEIPRNCANARDCGGCCVGCGTGEKNDTSHTFLADAVAAGAFILAGAHAEKVLLEKGGERGRKKKAAGVVATAMHGPLTADAPKKARGAAWRLVIRAPIVVAAAGTMHTPALLLRSGVKGRGWVGRNLRLHPATMVYGRFPSGFAGQDPATGPGAKTGAACDPAGAIKMFEGAIMSTFSKQSADWAGTGYGPMLMTPSMHPSGFSATTPWRGSDKSKAFVANYGDWSPVLVITRDRDAGRVHIDGRGLPRFRYWGSRFDRASMTAGIVQAVRVLVAAGAVEIGSFMEMDHCAVERGADGSVLDPAAVGAYIAAIEKAGIKKNRIAILSAHQMGTARMAADSKKGAVDGRGESFDASGLFVADGAAFPTSSGVNPMMTIEAIAYMVAESAAEAAGKTVPAPNGGFAPADHCDAVLASSVACGNPPVKRGPIQVAFE